MPTSHYRGATEADLVKTQSDLSRRFPVGVNVYHTRPVDCTKATSRTHSRWWFPTHCAQVLRGWIRSRNGAAPRTCGCHASTSSADRLTGSMVGAGVCVT